MLPDGPIETWDITIDPNAPLTGWRDVLLPRRSAFLDDPDHDDPDNDSDRDPDPHDDDPDPTPPSGQRGMRSGKGGKDPHASTRKDAPTISGKRSGNSGKRSGNLTAAHHSAPTAPHPSPRRRTLWRAAPAGAVLTAGSHTIGNDSGNDSGNRGNKIGKHSGNEFPLHTKSPSPVSERG